MSRTREWYTEAKIFVDGIPALKVGDFLRTKAGSCYCVTEIKQSGKRPNRRNLRVLRWPLDAIPADGAVFSLFWYPRKRRSAR